MMRLLLIGFLAIASLMPANTLDRRTDEPIVGGPCEGCEAVFDGLPAEIGTVVRIAPEDEPGQPMRIEGTVTDSDGNPAAGVVVYAYHTDQHGNYPSEGVEGGRSARRHGRLRAWVKTDANGRYRFDTIRPASYPNTTIPAHVHMHIVEPGRCTYYIASIHFADDPHLSERQRERYASTGRGGSGLVTPSRDDDGTWRVTRDIRLGEGVPGYPR